MLTFLKRARTVPLPLRAARRIFHGISIKTHGDFQCAAAIDLCGRRFLADEAPSLPLDGCADQQNCQCVYEHFDDRRTILRREADEGLPRKNYVDDARYGVGRRVTDG